MEQKEKTLQIPTEYISNIFGKFDENLKIIEKSFNVEIVNRGEHIKIIGNEGDINKTLRTLKQLITLADKKETIATQNIQYIISLVGENKEEEYSQIHSDFICMTINGKQIKSKTLGQKKYVNMIRNNVVVFGVGPAGTGKTYLAMAMAITALKNNEVNRIILTRPAIEAGEKLGFLPGDLQSKVDPYLRPLYDALYEIMGAETFLKNMEKGIIEVAPLAYMRGRTLDNSFIVLDEAQNTTPEQMKMFLTRIGFGSKAVVTGDITQIDLPTGKKSGLTEALKVLKEVEGVGISLLSKNDVVRHPLVQKIIQAYEKYENKKDKKR
ncbi:MAG: PhoH family protein [Epulopiscium sp.]|nr:PhoH family protein [Candidatus Epulonipiscium sp.]